MNEGQNKRQSWNASQIESEHSHIYGPVANT